MGVSFSIETIVIFIGSNYGKKVETRSAGWRLEYRRHAVSFCPVGGVASAEKGAAHRGGFSAVLWGWWGFSVQPPAGRRLHSWPARVPGTIGDDVPVVSLV